MVAPGTARRASSLAPPAPEVVSGAPKPTPGATLFDPGGRAHWSPAVQWPPHADAPFLAGPGSLCERVCACVSARCFSTLFLAVFSFFRGLFY